MEPGAGMPLWVLPLIPTTFVGMWIAVLLILAFASGWRALARRYAVASPMAGQTVYWGSASFNRFGLPVNFSNALNVGVGAQGVELKPALILGVFCPRLLIPWGEMGDCRSYVWFGAFRRFSFVTADPRVKITLAGRAAVLVDAGFGRFHPARTVSAAAV
jgi:hypothetical protein